MISVIKNQEKIDSVILPDGTTVVNPTGEPYYEIIRATVNSTGVTYCRLQYTSGDSYKWSGDHTEVNENTTVDDERWVKE
jgi:hypothetical protein